MNKKVAAIIIMVVFIVALVIVSIIGKVGLDWAQNITVRSIYIVDENGNALQTSSFGGKQVVKLEVELDDVNKTYWVYYKIEPTNADKQSVEFTVDENSASKVEVSGSGGSVLINFKEGFVPENGVQITIETTDGSEKKVSVLLVPKQPTHGETDL